MADWLIAGGGVTRVRESFIVLAIPRLMEWLWVAVPARRDRTHDLERDLTRLEDG